MSGSLTPGAVSATAATTAITLYYQNILGRAPDAAGLAGWTAAVTSGALTLAQVETAFISSTEAQTAAIPIIELYTALGSVPDKAGLSSWTTLADAGMSLSAIATAFLGSTTGLAIYGTNYGVSGTASSNTAFVTILYQEILGRSPDSVGLPFWVAKLTSGAMTGGQVLLAIATSAEATTRYAAGITTFLTAAGNGTAVYSGTLSTTSSASGTTYALTTGVDTLTGGPNATFVADNTGGVGKYTSSTADSITGTGTGNTLKIYSDATSTGDALPSLTNVQNLFINNIGANALNVSALTGVTSLQIDAPGASETVTVAGQAVTLSNETTGGYTLTVASTADTSESITLSKDGISTSSDTLDVSGTKVTSETITLSGGANYVAISDTGAAITSLTIQGTQNLTSVLTVGLDGSLTSISASAATGNLSISTVSALTPSTFTFTGGSGNNTLTVIASELTTLAAGSQLNGGTGTANTLVINDSTITTAEYTALNATKNFQILGLGTGATVNDSSITATFANHFSIRNTGSNTITKLVNGATVDVLAATTADVYSAAVGSNTLNLNIGASTSAGLTLTSETVTGYSTVNLSSNGTVANTISALVNSDNTSFVLTGSDAITFSLAAATSVGDKVDASAFTGKLTLTDSGKGDVILTGSAIAQITETSTTAADTITFLSGHTTTDTLTMAAQYTYTDVINNFALGQDTIKATAGALSVGSELSASSGVVLASAYATAAAFVTAAEAVSTGTAKTAVTWYDSTNNNTYVAEFGAAAINSAHIVELTGVHATAIGTTAVSGGVLIA